MEINASVARFGKELEEVVNIMRRSASRQVYNRGP
jgi:hypothetical protein